MEKELEQALNEMNEDQKTAMEKLLEWIKNEYTENNFDTLYTKAIDLLDVEKQQLIEFFIAGFKYAADSLEVDFEITDDYVEIAKNVAEEYYNDTYSDNIETE